MLNIIQKQLVNQLGGNKNNPAGFFTLLVLSLLGLFIKAYVVQIAYNTVGPKLLVNWGTNKHFLPITLWDSIILVILVSFLVH